MTEANRLGISKRIPSRSGSPLIPKDLELWKTIVYLAHPKACLVKQPVVLQKAMALVAGEQDDYPRLDDSPRLLESEKQEYKMGIFSAFIPHRIEKLIWEHDATPEELKSLEKRGITPVIIKDGDIDHA